MTRHDRFVRVADAWYKFVHKLTGRHFVRVIPDELLTAHGANIRIYECEKINNNNWVVKSIGSLHSIPIDKFRRHTAVPITFSR